MVEGEHLIEEHEAGVGHAEVVGGVLGQALDLADDVVGEEADGSGGEGWQAGNAGGIVAFEGVIPEGEDVAVDLTGARAFGDLDGAAARDELAIGLDADEGVAAEVFASFDGFEDEAFGLVCGKAQESGDGSLEIGREGAVERDQCMGACEAQEFRAGRKCVGSRLGHADLC